MARNYLSACRICNFYSKVLFCLSVFVWIWTYPQLITFMLIFQYFSAKICCIFYNIPHFVSVISPFSSVVIFTTFYVVCAFLRCQDNNISMLFLQSMLLFSQQLPLFVYFLQHFSPVTPAPAPKPPKQKPPARSRGSQFSYWTVKVSMKPLKWGTVSSLLIWIGR